MRNTGGSTFWGWVLGSQTAPLQGRSGVGAALPWELCSAGAEGAPGRAAPCLALPSCAWPCQTVPGLAKLCLALPSCAWPRQAVPGPGASCSSQAAQRCILVGSEPTDTQTQAQGSRVAPGACGECSALLGMPLSGLSAEMGVFSKRCPGRTPGDAVVHPLLGHPGDAQSQNG